MSAFLHLILFLVAVVVMKQANRMDLPSPYIVDLVSPSAARSVTRTHHASEHVSRKKRPAQKAMTASHKAEMLRKREKMKERIKEKRIEEKMKEMALERTEDNRVRDRIAELAAVDRIKAIYKLRQVISVPARGQESATKQPAQPQSQASGKGKGQTVGSYMDKITGEIWEQWSWPDKQEKNLEAVISVLIAKDGTVTVLKIEKKSGNTLFDRSALAAIRGASPVTPPPDGTEMEIGIRFFL
ncbi:MAG: cell envelope integrity protein TolA [Candidatus Sulfobium sp.]